MKYIEEIMKDSVLFILIVAAVGLFTRIAGAECDCSKDTAIPPFLAEGATPNLLLMIDNSASMYDTVYTDSTSESNGLDDDGDGSVDEEGEASLCYDDTFDSTATYVGYFENDTWYAYNLTSEEFDIATDGDCEDDTSWSVYSSGEVCVATSTSVDSEGNDVTTVEAFKAKGNFLNWASTSKYDIQKKILTGGKYDATTGLMESEGRGCSGNRFIRQTTVSNGGTDYQLVLGVRADWDFSDSVNTTLIDIFALTTDGFVPEKCQEAIEYMMGDPTGFGGVLQSINDCMEYDQMEEHQQGGEHDKQAMVHSLHDCWYLDKMGSWPSGGSQGYNYEAWCSDVYDRIDPREITPDDPAYICFGDSTDTDDEEGYIGECWTPAGTCNYIECSSLTEAELDGLHDSQKRCEDDSGTALEYVEYCDTWNTSKDGCQNKNYWTTYLECSGGAAVGSWKYSDETDPTLDDCLRDARERFCGAIQTSQVVDPSGLEMTTGETWNLPAMLMDQGAVGQLGLPLATTKGFVQRNTAPTGLLQEFSSEIRIGAMAFNHDGSLSECDMPEPHVKYACDDDSNRDGASVIWPIGSDDETTGHTDGLIAEINNTSATSWTPLAEAMYTAIGYYTQKADMELSSGLDYSTYDAPITKFCQSNNVLFITDGSSTADLNSEMVSFAEQAAVMDDPDDGDDSAGCGDLYGSTYFDDLAFFARQGNIFDGSPYTFEETPENISSWVVFTGDTADTGDECAAYTLMENAVTNGGPNAVNSPGSDEVLLGEDAEKLSLSLREAFESILKRAAAGSAASVISATRSGEGAVYQAIFWPAKTGPEVSGVQLADVTWTGEVHALLMDSDGNLYEDTNSDRTLDVNSDENVVFYFDEDENETVACYGGLDDDGVCTGAVKDLDEVKYLWSAAEWLAGVSDANINDNRDSYISNVQKRYIYTWNDLNNDGVADTNEWIAFEPDTAWNGFDVSGAVATRGTVPYDFGVDPTSVADADSEVDSIVSWIRGDDAAGYRSRELEKPANFNVAASVNGTITWRLGDVIYSTPTSVARPEENYHMVYRDDSYVDFVAKYKNRRHMVYFGANDGMIHAINSGFFDATTNKFWKGYEDTDSDGVYEYTDPAGAPALGAEMWAYVPYNLQPQLKCLRETSYGGNHKYFVDLKPRIFDVRIFSEDSDHPNGWGTIMVAGMRFGGGSVDADVAGDIRKFVSAYMIFDITNPEEPPVLLGELTYDSATSARMGYTTMVPVVTPMKETDEATGDVTTKWYLVLGSGPLVLDASDNWEYNTAIGGVSNQAAKVAVIPLDTIASGGAFRIADAAPDASTAGIIPLMDDQGTEDVTDDTAVEGFVSDPISVDFDLSNDYRADAVYFGTVEGDWTGWAGRLYRLVTYADDGITDPGTWELKEMLNPQRPVTAAPMAGWDGRNFWIYFGTGRFFDEDDKSNAGSIAQETFYGLKEPVSCSDGVTFEWPTLSTASLQSVGSIRVAESPDVTAAALSCYDFDSVTETYSEDATGACLPTGVTTFSELDTYIAGTGCVENVSTGEMEHSGMAGWAHAFDLSGERNMGQATLLGGLLTFTTYQPFDDLCKLEGEAFLYALYYRTGTSWHESVFDTGGTDPVEYKKDIGRGLATTPNLHVGKEEGGTAYAQTSTGAIVEIEQPNMPIDEVKTGRMYWRTD